MTKRGYVCPKCESTAFDMSEFRAAGGFWTKVFDVQSKKFTTITRKHCRYTEPYQADSSKLGNIFDFFTD